MREHNIRCQSAGPKNLRILLPVKCYDKIKCIQHPSGPDLLLAGPLFRKKCGALIYEYPLPPATAFIPMHSSHHRHFVEDPLFPNHFNISDLLPFCKKMKKKLCFCEALFCGGGDVRPNMLNMRKSASDIHNCVIYVSLTQSSKS